MPLIKETTLNAFCELCRSYGLPDNPKKKSFNWSLLNIYAERQNGAFHTELEHLEDGFPLFDLANILWQIKKGRVLGNNYLSISNGVTASVTYSNVTTIEVIEQGVAELLKKRVIRYGSGLVVWFGSGPDGGYYIRCDKPETESDFSLDELECILNIKDSITSRAKLLNGRKANNSKEYTRVEDLRPKVQGILKHTEKYDLPIMRRYSFVFDFLAMSHYLDFRGDDWVQNKDSDKEKYTYIKSLL